jgi:hypothetical protein
VCACLMLYACKGAHTFFIDQRERERERERLRERKREGEREREIEIAFIIKRNDRCLGIL